METVEKRKRKFTEKQLALLERYHYLHFKLYHGGLTEEEDDDRYRLVKKICKFIEIW